MLIILLSWNINTVVIQTLQSRRYIAVVEIIELDNIYQFHSNIFVSLVWIVFILWGSVHTVISISIMCWGSTNLWLYCELWRPYICVDDTRDRRALNLQGTWLRITFFLDLFIGIYSMLLYVLCKASKVEGEIEVLYPVLHLVSQALILLYS